MTLGLGELFLGAWAIIATVAYYLEHNKAVEFKVRTSIILEALADGKAKFVKQSNGQIGIETVAKGE